MAVFEQKEVLARQQFHSLFCADKLYSGVEQDAVNDQPWNEQIMWEILTRIYPANPLTPADISTIMQLCGMYREQGLYFHYRDEQMPKFLIAALSPYITNKAFVKYSQEVQGTVDTVKMFLKACCCNPKIKAIRVSTKDFYDIYSTWCVANMLVPMGKIVFAKYLKRIGYKITKGYVKGKCGVAFVMVAIDMERVNQFYERPAQEQERTEKEELHSEDDSWREAQSRAEDVLERQEEASREADDGSDVRYGTGDDQDVRKDTRTGTPDIGDRGTGDQDIGASGDGVADDAGSSADQTDAEGTGHEPVAESVRAVNPTLERVNKLPMALRRMFKELKMTYRVSPEHFNFDDFDVAVNNLGMKCDDYLRDLFQDYIES